MSGIGIVSNLTILFLDKPPGGSLPVFSAPSFDSYLQFALLESAEEGNFFSTKECVEWEGQYWDRCLPSKNTTEYRPSFSARSIDRSEAYVM